MADRSDIDHLHHIVDEYLATLIGSNCAAGSDEWIATALLGLRWRLGEDIFWTERGNDINPVRDRLLDDDPFCLGRRGPFRMWGRTYTSAHLAVLYLLRAVIDEMWELNDAFYPIRRAWAAAGDKEPDWSDWEAILPVATGAVSKPAAEDLASLPPRMRRVLDLLRSSGVPRVVRRWARHGGADTIRRLFDFRYGELLTELEIEFTNARHLARSTLPRSAAAPPASTDASARRRNIDGQLRLVEPNRIRVGENEHQLRPQLWQLLKLMMDRQSVAIHSALAREVWDDENVRDATVRATVSKFNTALLDLNIPELPWRLHCEDGYIVKE